MSPRRWAMTTRFSPWVSRWDAEAGADGLLLGVDAPLLVPNETGSGPARRRSAGGLRGSRRGRTRPTGRSSATTCAGSGWWRGWQSRGSPMTRILTPPRQAGVRQMMEVFPHPAHVVLFGLARTLKYKAKPGRDYPSRWAAMNEYSRHLRGLTAHDPPLTLPADWPPADVAGLIGGALKRLEDGMDALTCAYIVYWYWWHGRQGRRCIGRHDGRLHRHSPPARRYNSRMPVSPLPVLHTPRLTLRPLTVADTDAVYRMIDASRDSFSRWFRLGAAPARTTPCRSTCSRPKRRWRSAAPGITSC